jgi:hypothetical protein
MPEGVVDSLPLSTTFDPFLRIPLISGLVTQVVPSLVAIPYFRCVLQILITFTWNPWTNMTSQSHRDEAVLYYLRILETCDYLSIE